MLFRSNIDDGAMQEVVSSTMFKKVKHRLGTILLSSQLLCLANGAVVQSEARWKGEIEVNGVSTKVTFEVFNSGGKWDFLFRKTLLEAFDAVHDYKLDEIQLKGKGGETTLRNQTCTIKHLHQPASKSTICITTEETQPGGENGTSEVNVEAFQEDSNLFTRMTKPFKLERVKEILQLVTIGDDLSTSKQKKVQDLVSSFTDIFALSVSKVKVVENATHHLNIPTDTKFPLKVHQKPLTPPQCRYLYESIDTMLKAGIIEACKLEDVKCISATTLAQKAHQGKGHSLEELQHTSVSSMGWSLGLTYHQEQHPHRKTIPQKKPNGEFARISPKSTKL